jgi:hypothetical protein
MAAPHSGPGPSPLPWDQPLRPGTGGSVRPSTRARGRPLCQGSRGSAAGLSRTKSVGGPEGEWRDPEGSDASGLQSEERASAPRTRSRPGRDRGRAQGKPPLRAAAFWGPRPAAPSPGQLSSSDVSGRQRVWMLSASNPASSGGIHLAASLGRPGVYTAQRQLHRPTDDNYIAPL